MRQNLPVTSSFRYDFKILRYIGGIRMSFYGQNPSLWGIRNKFMKGFLDFSSNKEGPVCIFWSSLTEHHAISPEFTSCTRNKRVLHEMVHGFGKSWVPIV